MPAAGVLLIAVLFFVWTGCGKDNTTEPSQSKIHALAIICNPLSPSPDTTAWLTVQPVGEGGVPKYKWQVEDGTLLSDTSISVQWVVPDTTGVFKVSVKVTLGAAVDTMSKYIMVRHCITEDTGVDFSFAPLFSEGLIIIGSRIPASNANFFGYHVYRGGTQITSNGTPTVDGGENFTFIGDYVLASVVTNANPVLNKTAQSMNVILFPLSPFGSKRYVSNNDQLGLNRRKNQHLNPSATNNLRSVVWEAHSVKSDDGREDLVNIAYRKETEPIQILTIAKDSTLKSYGWLYRYFHNIKPMITPDEKNILYFVDSTGRYEPCIIPLDATTGQPVIGGNKVIERQNGRRIFRNSGVQVSEKTIFQWNPAAETELGFIDLSGKFCLLDYADSTVEIADSLGAVQEFTWSDDGEAAVINKTGVWIVTPPGGAPHKVFSLERPENDVVIGVNWSPPNMGEKSLAFRLTRKGISSAESFSALVYYSIPRKQWYYASPRIPASSMEPDVDYRWFRVSFDPSGFGMYAPVPTEDGVVLKHSY
jgi:hypothetical protein